MAKQDLTRVYSGGDLSGATAGVIYLPIVRDSTLEKVSVRSDAAQSGDAVFALSKNGTVITGLSALTIANGAKVGTVSGLSVALTDGDEIVLNLLSGNVSAPVTLNLGTDDGSQAQQTITQTTASIADDATTSVSVALGKYALLSNVAASRACRVRLYSTAAHRTADAARSIGVDPAGEHGVLLDAVIEAGNLWLDLSPVVSLFDGETVRTGAIAALITNLSGATGTVAVSFSVLILEN